MYGRLIADVSCKTADTISCYKVSRMSAVSVMDYVNITSKKIIFRHCHVNLKVSR